MDCVGVAWWVLSTAERREPCSACSTALLKACLMASQLAEEKVHDWADERVVLKAALKESMMALLTVGPTVRSWGPYRVARRECELAGALAATRAVY